MRARRAARSSAGQRVSAAGASVWRRSHGVPSVQLTRSAAPSIKNAPVGLYDASVTSSPSRPEMVFAAAAGRDLLNLGTRSLDRTATPAAGSRRVLQEYRSNFQTVPAALAHCKIRADTNSRPAAHPHGARTRGRARRPGGRHTPHDNARAPRAPRRSPLLQHAHHLRHERSRQRRRRPRPDTRPARLCHVATPNLHGHIYGHGGNETRKRRFFDFVSQE